MKKSIVAIMLTIAASVGLTACGGSSMSADRAVTENVMEMEDAYAEEDYDTAAGTVLEERGTTVTAGEDTVEVESENRKLIKTVSLDVETKDYDGLLASLEAQIKELGGYVENLDCYGSSYRNAYITARIPTGKLDGFVSRVGEEANITSRSESVEDVTLQYVDLDSHIRMLQEEQERLLELLETAETVEDMITIESRLGEIRYQLESMNSQLRTIDNQVDYSTVHISIDEVVELTPAVELTDGERIAQGFSKSVADVCHGIKEFFIGLLINIPYIIVWGIVIIILLLIARVVIKQVDKRSKRLTEEMVTKRKAEGHTGIYARRPSENKAPEEEKDNKQS